MPVRGSSTVRTVFTAAALAVILAVLWFGRSFLTTSSAVIADGSGARIVVSVGGSDRDVVLNVKSFVKRDGMEIFFSFTTDDVDYKSKEPPGPLDVRITFAGLPHDARVECGEGGTAVSQSKFRKLPQGARTAIEVDARSGRSSAIAYDPRPGSPGPTESSISDYKSERFLQHKAEMWLLEPGWGNDGERSSPRATTERSHGSGRNDASLPEQSVWFVAPDFPTPVRDLQRSLLLPQLNATGLRFDERGPVDVSCKQWIERDSESDFHGGLSTTRDCR